MQAFQTCQGVVAPLDRLNVDTDAIIPKDFLKIIDKKGLGQHVFDNWRQQPDFVLHNPHYQSAKILLTRANFGCGSSREHAVWALMDYGFCVVIGESFADIFANNCVKNGLLTIALSKEIIEKCFQQVHAQPGCAWAVDLNAQTITTQQGEKISFQCPASIKQKLLLGLDEIAETLQHKEQILAFEKSRAQQQPWLFEQH